MSKLTLHYIRMNDLQAEELRDARVSLERLTYWNLANPPSISNNQYVLQTPAIMRRQRLCCRRIPPKPALRVFDFSGKRLCYEIRSSEDD